MNILLAIADSNKEYLRKISEELQGYSDLPLQRRGGKYKSL